MTYFPRLHDFQKHDRGTLTVEDRAQCDALLPTAEAKMAHIQEKHQMFTGCQAEHSPASRPHWESRCWCPAWARNRSTSVQTVGSVAVKIDTNQVAVLEPPDDQFEAVVSNTHSHNTTRSLKDCRKNLPLNLFFKSAESGVIKDSHNDPPIKIHNTRQKDGLYVLSIKTKTYFSHHQRHDQKWPTLERD